MTLREWFERESRDDRRLSYGSDSGLEYEYSVLEIVYSTAHCMDCAEWYIWRDKSDGKLWRCGPDGSSVDGVTEVSEEDLEKLTMADFEIEEA